ncbi:MAG: N-acetylmuramoyl-L-alanine amidase, partial [Thermodesulfobacteriota bacterium]|nr:N-acetylmuramoyl-L-alanine amidase [Thermodesulfobacteriota bacterium]
MAGGLVFTGPAGATSARTEFRSALRDFQSLLKDPQKAHFRDSWTKSYAKFRKVLNKDPNGPYAAKSLYYMARTHEELVRRSGLRKDALMAADTFQRAVNRFPPGHSWVDDCLYRKAEITYLRLGDSRSAVADLRLQLKKYPRGDFAKKAKKLLSRIQKKPPETRLAAPKAASPKKLKTEYERSVNRFKVLRRKTKNARRDKFLALGNRFKAVFEKDPDGPYAAKSLYFIGFTYEELGKRSGRDADFTVAADYFKRAAKLFPEGHTWVDDCLYKEAHLLLTRLDEPDQAYANLLHVVHDYPNGDMAAQAKALLRRMDETKANEIADRKAGVTPAKSGEKTPAQAGNGPAKLMDIRYRSSDDYTRIVLDMDKAIRFEDHPLPPDPELKKSHRMYIDLPGASLSPGIRPEIKVADGFLRTIRTGQNTPDTARVVLDFKKSQKYHLFTLENPYRIVVDVFARAKDEEPQAPEKQTARAKKTPSEALKEKRPTKAGQKVARDVLSQLGMTIKTIMIDPGHGGRDPGAVHYVKKGGRKKIDLKEKDVTLRMSKILGHLLMNKGYTVLYTRTKDTKVQLEDRALTANLKKADLFISLHCNANRSNRVKGFETYYLGKARNDVVLRLAALENNVDPVKIS